MKQSVSFLKMKLTNNTLDQFGHVRIAYNLQCYESTLLLLLLLLILLIAVLMHMLHVVLCSLSLIIRSSCTRCTATSPGFMWYRQTALTQSATDIFRPSPSQRLLLQQSLLTRTPRCVPFLCSKQTNKKSYKLET